MTSTPDGHVPANDDLEELEGESEDDLLSPEERLLRGTLPEATPTDAIGSEDWGRQK